MKPSISRRTLLKTLSLLLFANRGNRMGFSAPFTASFLPPFDRGGVPALQAFNAYIATLSPIIDLRMDETSGTTATNYGSAGANANGTYVNGPTLAQSGQIGSAVQFDGSNDYLSIPFHASWANLTTFEWVLLLKVTGGSTEADWRFFGRDLSPLGRVIQDKPSGGVFEVRLRNTVPSVAITRAAWAWPTYTWNTLNLAYDNAGDRKAHIYLNATEQNYLTQPALTGTYQTANSGQTFMASQIPNAGVKGLLNRVLLFNRVLSSAERQNITRLSGLSIASAITKQVVCHGDSLTLGSTDLADPYPHQLHRLLRDGWTVFKIGTGGFSTNALTSERASVVDPFYNASLNKNIICAFMGTNDLAGGDTATTLQSDIQAYVSAAQAIGWKVVVFTVLPRSGGSPVAGFETERTAYNTWLRANWNGFADGFADVAADTRIGDAGDDLDTTYYSDGTHPTQAGYAIIASIAETAVESV